MDGWTAVFGCVVVGCVTGIVITLIEVLAKLHGVESSDEDEREEMESQ